MLRKRMFAVAAALLLMVAFVVAASGCSSSSSGSGGESAASSEPIKVGAILSLTGPYAALGTAEKNALDLEVKRINDAGGVDGRQLEVIIEDDATDESKAVTAATKLIEQDKVVAILGATGTGQSMAARTVIDRAGIPQISMAGGNAITGKFDKLVFQTPWSNAIVVPFVLEKVAADGHKKIAVISDNGGYGKDGLAIITTAAPEAGLTIVSNETFKPGDTDFAAQLTNAKNSGADAILCCGPRARKVRPSSSRRARSPSGFRCTEGPARRRPSSPRAPARRPKASSSARVRA